MFHLDKRSNLRHHTWGARLFLSLCCLTLFFNVDSSLFLQWCVLYCCFQFHTQRVTPVYHGYNTKMVSAAEHWIQCSKYYNHTSCIKAPESHSNQKIYSITSPNFTELDIRASSGRQRSKRATEIENLSSTCTEQYRVIVSWLNMWRGLGGPWTWDTESKLNCHPTLIHFTFI